MIDIKIYNVTSLFTNCYLLTDKATGEMAVVDPGDKSEELIDYIKKSNNSLKYVLLTHGHYDHIGYAKQLATMFDSKIVCGENTDKFFKNNMLNHSVFHPDIKEIKAFDGDILLKDNDKILLGETEITYITTEGHTDGCGCYIFDNTIITGDTLFAQSYGRTDLPTGSINKMIESMKKLKELKGDYVVYPGHGESTTLDFERKYNPLMSRI